MRVVMFTWEFPPHAAGGMAAQVDGLAHSLAEGGDEVVVVTRRIANEPADAMVAGVRVLRADCDLPWVDCDPVAAAASANHHLLSAAASLDGWRPDIVHAHDWNVAWAGRSMSTIASAPLVTTFHGTARSRHGGHVPPGAATDIDNVEWWLALQSATVTTITRTIQRSIISDFELDPHRAVLIPSGIDPTWWCKMSDADTTTPGFVFAWGRVQYEKGFQVLARAVGTLRGRLDPISCMIAGRGSYLPELQSQIDLSQAGEVVDLPGFLEGNELRDTLHRARCVVIPSLYEPFGVVALEALASGAALVAADTGGLAEILAGTDAALLFEPGNADALAECIERVLTDRELAHSLADNGQRLIDRRYAWEAVASEVRAVYSNALGNG